MTASLASQSPMADLSASLARASSWARDSWPDSTERYCWVPASSCGGQVGVGW